MDLGGLTQGYWSEELAELVRKGNFRNEYLSTVSLHIGPDSHPRLVFKTPYASPDVITKIVEIIGEFNGIRDSTILDWFDRKMKSEMLQGLKYRTENGYMTRSIEDLRDFLQENGRLPWEGYSSDYCPENTHEFNYLYYVESDNSEWSTGDIRHCFIQKDGKFIGEL